MRKIDMTGCPCLRERQIRHPIRGLQLLGAGESAMPPFMMTGDAHEASDELPPL